MHINGNERLKIITDFDGNAKCIKVDEKFEYTEGDKSLE